MTELKQGRIYKIISDSTDKIYVGSTYTNLAQRLAQHRAQYKQYINEKADYITSFELIKNGNCSIVLIESFECNSREQLRAREAHWIKELKDHIVNKSIPNRTSLDYYYDNKIEKIMLGQKWLRRNEILSVDIEPNNNLRTYEDLTGNLKTLRDNLKRYTSKIRREEDENNILFDYND